MSYEYSEKVKDLISSFDFDTVTNYDLICVVKEVIYRVLVVESNDAEEELWSIKESFNTSPELFELINKIESL